MTNKTVNEWISELNTKVRTKGMDNYFRRILSGILDGAVETGLIEKTDTLDKAMEKIKKGGR